MVSNTAIQVLTEGDPVVGCARMMPSEEIRRFAVAREAEVLAMTQMLKLQDMLPEVEALSLAGIVAKLDMIVGADRDIGDPTDFPWPHIASALRDLKAIAGDMPAYRPRRSTTRVDVAVHWEGAARLIACLEADEAAARSERTTRPI
ncbi:hypothetical protein FJ425_23825 [Mesorhizobium sp. B2-7-2]|nr:hypothetical protein FJ425_23825 [Mesorhizobium sp. B2-7-2]